MSISYQVDRPRRSVFNLVAMLIAGAAGVASALVADFVQKGDASAIIVMNSFVNQSLSLNLPLGYLALIMLGAGAVSVFVFEPATKRAAYYTGASILAVLMTTMPVDDLEKALPLFEEILMPQEPDDAAYLGTDNQAMAHEITGAPCFDVKSGGLPLIKAAYAPAVNIACSNDRALGQAEVTPIAADDLNVTVAISLPKGAMPKIAARLHDDVSCATWRLTGGRASRTGSGYIVRYKLSIPAPQARTGMLADLHVRVEADGFKIAHEHAKVTRRGPVILTVGMAKSDTPLWLQKLSTPYRF